MNVSAVPHRRAVVLFPSSDELAELEAVRRRWDPVMAARIAAHVTLVHDVTDRRRCDELLAAAARATAPIEMTLTTTARWGASTRGIYLAIERHDDGIDTLHDALAPVEDARWLRFGYRPHVTVVHARYTDPATADAAWAELADWSPNVRVRVDRVAVIEMHDTGWATVAEVPLAASSGSPAIP